MAVEFAACQRESGASLDPGRFHTTESNGRAQDVRADLEALPRLLDHIDALISDGTIGGERLNAADFQIAASVRLLMCLDDLRPCIERHPAARFAKRVAPHFPGHVRAVLPPEWLAPLRESPVSAAAGHA